MAVGPAKVKIEKDPRKAWESPQNFGKYKWPKKEGAASGVSLAEQAGSLAGQAGQLLGTVANLTGSKALGNIAQGLGGAAGMAGGLSQGGAMGLATAAVGAAANYIPGLSSTAQGLQAVQGLVALDNTSARLSNPDMGSHVASGYRTPGFAG